MAFNLNQLAFLIPFFTYPFVVWHPGYKESPRQEPSSRAHNLVGDERVSVKETVSKVAMKNKGTDRVEELQTLTLSFLTAWPHTMGNFWNLSALVYTSEDEENTGPASQLTVSLKRDDCCVWHAGIL